MSLEHPTAGETAEADKIDAMLRETGAFQSPGLRRNRRARRKREELFRRNRQAHSTHPDADQGERPGFFMATPGDDLPKFRSRNPNHTLAPYVVPVWDPAISVVVRLGWSIDLLLRRPEFLELVSTYNPKVTSRLDQRHCYWHDGPIRANSLGDRQCWLLTQVSGQWIGVWWVCAHCRQNLDRRYPGGICWRKPSRIAVK